MRGLTGEATASSSSGGGGWGGGGRASPGPRCPVALQQMAGRGCTECGRWELPLHLLTEPQLLTQVSRLPPQPDPSAPGPLALTACARVSL